MAKKPPPHVLNLEASQRAILGSALAARRKLSAARADHGLRDRPEFYTREEVDEIKAEHRAEIKAVIQGLVNPPKAISRIAALFAHHKGPIDLTLTPEQRMQLDWYNTLALAQEIIDERAAENATKATDDAIKCATRNRR